MTVGDLVNAVTLYSYSTVPNNNRSILCADDSSERAKHSVHAVQHFDELYNYGKSRPAASLSPSLAMTPPRRPGSQQYWPDLKASKSCQNKKRPPYLCVCSDRKNKPH